MNGYNVNYRYFNLSPDKFGPFSFPKVTPTEEYVDVFSNHYWRNNKNSNPYETPSVVLTEYSLRFGTTVTNIAQAFKFTNDLYQYAANSEYIDPYQTLYYGDPTKFKYVLPYLIKDGDSIRGTTNNNWTKIQGVGGFINDVQKQLESGGGDISKAIAEGIVGIKAGVSVLESTVAGFGLEDTYKFNNTNRKRIKISFPLYNTFDVKSAFDNFSFVTLFGLQNLKLRTTWLTYIPPKIYSIDGIGIGNLYMPAAYVSSYNISSIGTTRRLSEYGLDGYGGILIPEAYKVDIEFTELVPESTNIMTGSLGGDKVNVVSTAAFNTLPSNATQNRINIPRSTGTSAGSFGLE